MTTRRAPKPSSKTPKRAPKPYTACGAGGSVYDRNPPGQFIPDPKDDKLADVVAACRAHGDFGVDVANTLTVWQPSWGKA